MNDRSNPNFLCCLQNCILSLLQNSHEKEAVKFLLNFKKFNLHFFQILRFIFRFTYFVHCYNFENQHTNGFFVHLMTYFNEEEKFTHWGSSQLPSRMKK